MDREDELKRHLSTLWRTAMVGLGTMREVVLRSTQTGRLRVDIAFLQRERAQLLEQLGESVLHLVDGGELELPVALSALVQQIHEVQDRLRSDTARAVDNAFGAPRGYEPEAASDYGPDHYDTDEASDSDGQDDPASIGATSPAGRSQSSNRIDEAEAKSSKPTHGRPARKLAGSRATGKSKRTSTKRKTSSSE